MPTRIYRNDSETTYDIPGLGEVPAGQRISFSGEFPPAINLENYPGLVDVQAEEDSGTQYDYEKSPEGAPTASTEVAPKETKNG